MSCSRRQSPAPYVAVGMFYDEQHYQTAADLAPILAYVTDAPSQTLIDENMDYINANETTVRTTTVQAHIEDTYTPGDRLQHARPSGSRRPAHRRQAPRLGGYSCSAEGCDRIFDRACELK